MVVTWGRSKVHSDFDGTRSSKKYEVVASDSVSVVVRSRDFLSDEDRLLHIHFEGDWYWIETSFGNIREYFRRVSQ